MIGKHIKKKLNLRDRYYNVNKNTSLGGVSKLNIKNKKSATFFKLTANIYPPQEKGEKISNKTCNC